MIVSKQSKPHYQQMPKKKMPESTDNSVFVDVPRINVSSIDLPLQFVIAFQILCNGDHNSQRQMFQKMLEMFLRENIENIARSVDVIQSQVLRQFPELTVELFPWEAAFVMLLMEKPKKFTKEHINIAVETIQKGEPFAMTRAEFIDSVAPNKTVFIGGIDPLINRISDEDDTLSAQKEK
jgi:hypothetical protein